MLARSALIDGERHRICTLCAHSRVRWISRATQMRLSIQVQYMRQNPLKHG